MDPDINRPERPYKQGLSFMCHEIEQVDGCDPIMFEYKANLAAASQLWPLIFRSNGIDIDVIRVSGTDQACYAVAILGPHVGQQDEITFSTVEQFGGYECLAVVTMQGLCHIYPVLNIWDAVSSIEESMDPSNPFYIRSLRGKFSFHVTAGISAWGVSLHPTRTYIAITSNTRSVALYYFDEISQVIHPLSILPRLPGNLPHVKIVPLPNKGALSFFRSDCSDEVSVDSFLIEFTVLKLTDGDEAAMDVGKLPPGFVGHWLVRCKEIKLYETRHCFKKTAEPIWLVASLPKHSALVVENRYELLGPTRGEFKEGHTVAGAICKTSPLDVLMDPKPRWISKHDDRTSELEQYLTVAEQIELQNKVRLYGSNSQVFVCEPLSFEWLSAASGCALLPFSWPTYLPQASPLEEIRQSFSMWTVIEKLSLIVVISRQGHAVFLRITKYPDETMGLRIEGVLNLETPIVGICSMPLRSCSLHQQRKKVAGRKRYLKDFRSHFAEVLDPTVGLTGEYLVILFMEGDDALRIVIS